jgi:hypothetical protein
VTNPTDTIAICPGCQHPAHDPDVECEGGVDHGSKHWHRCLCLNRPGSSTACHPLMDCQGGKLGYSDIWYLQRGHTLSSADGPVTPDALTAPPAALPVSVVSGQTLRDRVVAALYEARRPGLGGMSEAEAVAYMADAVLAVLPPDGHTTNRADVLREAADRIDQTREPFPIAVQNGITWATAELRRLAAEAPQPEPDTACAHCGSSDHSWDGCEAYTKLVTAESAVEETGVELARHIADRPVSEIQAAFRILGWPPLRFELAAAQPARHAPGKAILCPDCAAKGRAVCTDDRETRPAARITNPQTGLGFATGGNWPAAVVPAAGAGQDETQEADRG